MNAMQQTASPSVQQALDEKLAGLAKPGVVFSEPVKEGNYTVITAAEYRVRRGKPLARPVAVIIVSPNGVEVRRFRDPAKVVGMWALLLGIVLWASAIILYPPWKPEHMLLDDVAGLMRTLNRLSQERY